MKKIIWAIMIIVILIAGVAFYLSRGDENAAVTQNLETPAAIYTYEIRKSGTKQKLDFDLIRRTDSEEEIIFSNLYAAVADLIGFNKRYAVYNVLTSVSPNESYERLGPTFMVIPLSNNTPNNKLYFTINPCPDCAPGGSATEKLISFDIETKTFAELNSSSEFYDYRASTYSVSPDGSKVIQIRREGKTIVGFDLVNDKFSSITPDLGNENYTFMAGGTYGGPYTGEATWIDNDKFKIEVFDETEDIDEEEFETYLLVKVSEFSLKEDFGL